MLSVKTYSGAVNLALAETLRLKKIESLPQFFGKGLWQGDLSEMREDRPRTRTHRSTKQARNDGDSGRSPGLRQEAFTDRIRRFNE